MPSEASNQIKQNEKKTYIDARGEYALNEFCDAFYELIETEAAREIAVVCIGSDRATGDSFGPIVGHMLTTPLGNVEGVRLYGTLEKPVHAKNIAEVKQNLYEGGKNPLVVAVDACLGNIEHVGCLNTGYGVVRPGAGLGKNLPEIGDVYVTGIVNFYGVTEFLILQNTRLSLVMRMAEIVYSGILISLLKLRSEYMNAGNNLKTAIW